jgi:NAD(P)H-hydrate epimerase
VTVAIPCGTPLFFGIPKALIVHQINTGKACDPAMGFYTVESAEQIALLAEKMQTVAIGPGLAKNAQTVQFLKTLLPLMKTSLVLDADALNIIAENPDLFQFLNERTILTPHPGEMARLMRAACLDYQNLSRTQQAAALAQYTGAAVVLKGPGTVIAAPDGRVAVNLSGSPELATAGSGDLLTGIISTVSAHGYDSFESACAGVYLHGMLGGLCCPGKPAMEQGAGIIADDLLLQIGNAIMKLRKNRKNI